jgi:dienelactone hydrolase
MLTKLDSGTSLVLEQPAPRPARGVVLLPDLMGLRPLYVEMAAELAGRRGWAVAIPEPYPGREDLRLGDRLRGLRHYDWARQRSDCLAAADMLEAQRIGLLGFCLGGTGAIRSAARERFDRVVACYGMIRLPSPWKAEGTTDPIDDLASVPGAAAKLLSIAGTADEHVPESHQDELEGLGARVVRYPGAGHGFIHDPGAAEHRADDAADAWARAVDWLS